MTRSRSLADEGAHLVVAVQHERDFHRVRGLECAPGHGCLPCDHVGIGRGRALGGLARCDHLAAHHHPPADHLDPQIGRRVGRIGLATGGQQPLAGLAERLDPRLQVVLGPSVLGPADQERHVGRDVGRVRGEGIAGDDHLVQDRAAADTPERATVHLRRCFPQGFGGEGAQGGDVARLHAQRVQQLAGRFGRRTLAPDGQAGATLDRRLVEEALGGQGEQLARRPTAGGFPSKAMTPPCSSVSILSFRRC
jgi:hypothetical protein